MEPSKQQSHVAPEVAVACFFTRPEDTVAVCLWEKQNLFDEEGCGVTDGLRRPTQPFRGLLEGIGIVSRDTQKNLNPIRQWARPDQPDLRGSLYEIKSYLQG
jgi:hypothetical protein